MTLAQPQRQLRTGRLRAALVVTALLSIGCGSDGDSSGAQDPEPFDRAGSPTSTTSSTVPRAPDDDSAPTTSEVQSTTSATSTTSTEAPRSTVPLDRLDLSLEPIATLNAPVAMVAHPITGQLIVAEKRGIVLDLETGESLLDVVGSVSGGNEQGLLGIAFEPDGSALYTNLTDRSGDTVVTRYGFDDAVIDVESAVEILRVGQLRANHNGGHLAFGPDGHLYVGLGDGGGGGDPGDNGQDTFSLLGTMLRIAPTPTGYDIPPDNPFADGLDGAPEVFAWGLRNPWRYSFDPETGDLWIGDVGQDRFEEISVARAADGLGRAANYGWNESEGFDTYRGGSEPLDHHRPFAVYSQSAGRCSVTGGEVYRGGAIPSLVGTYVFGDFCTGELFGLDTAGDGTIVALRIPGVAQVASFAVDASGELYALSLDGPILRITG